MSDAALRSPDLGARAARTTLVLAAVQAVVVFGAAGTLDYWQGWAYVVLQLASLGGTHAWLWRHDPALLERRLSIEQTGEIEPAQRAIVGGIRALILGLLAASGLTLRLGGPMAPPWTVAAGIAIYGAGAALVFRVFQANSYAASVVTVDDRQTVVRTGPYALVRHPMYTGSLLMGLGTPLVLGSWPAELVMLPMTALVAARIVAEERLLVARLDGYAAYTKATRWRLLPGVW